MRIKLDRAAKLRLLGAAAFNFFVYGAGRMLAQQEIHTVMTTVLDNRIPFLPWTIVIYLGCYLFWAVNYCLAVSGEQEGSSRLILAHFLGETVCFAAFVCLPATLVRPEVAGTGIFQRLVRLTYRLDQADNLFPSVHCFVSWLCWLGVRNKDGIPRWYRHFSLVMALAVCVSTLTVKQHVIADVFAGVLLAQVSWMCAGAAGESASRASEG